MTGFRGELSTKVPKQNSSGFDGMGLEGLFDILLAMNDMHLNAEFLIEMLGQMLGTVDATVLAAGAAEAEHQVGETTLNVALDVVVGQLIN